MCVLLSQPLSCPPAMKIITTSRNSKTQRFLLRGDSEGYVTLWNVPDITIEEVKQIQDRNTIKSRIFYFNFMSLKQNKVVSKPQQIKTYKFSIQIHRFNANDLYESK